MTLTTPRELFPQALREAIASHAAEYDRQGEFPEKSLQSLREARLLGLTVPEDLGGFGQGPTAVAQVLEQIAESDASVAMIFLMHLCATEVIKQSTMPAREAILRAIAAGQHLSTLAFSEKGSRSHFWVSMATVKVDGERHLLQVQKSFVTTAGHADSYVVSLRASEAKAPTDSSIYLVEARHGGWTTQPWDGLGLRANASRPMAFDCAVGPGDRVSPDGGGFNVMLSVVLPWFTLGSSAVANGIAKGALEAATRHLQAARFEYAGNALSSLPTVWARLAAARVSLDAARSLTWETARAIEQPTEETMLRVLQCKASSGEMALQVTDAAMRLCGGAAFAKTLPVERYFRDARACSVMAPTSDVLYEFIGKSLLGLPLF
ncbi:MAG TPA: acyl-CoA dehydrogenase family protein [Candidatus Xenobia bacterium]